MTIKYLLDAQGGFTCGDTATGLTSYAYPTSTYGTLARTMAPTIAAEMVGKEANGPYREEFDGRNWARMNAADGED